MYFKANYTFKVLFENQLEKLIIKLEMNSTLNCETRFEVV